MRKYVFDIVGAICDIQFIEQRSTPGGKMNKLDYALSAIAIWAGLAIILSYFV